MGTLYWDTLKDFEPFRKSYFEVIASNILDGNLALGKSEVSRLYIPKKGGFVRPITYLGFQNTVVYQAFSNILAETFLPELSLNYNKLTFGNHINHDSHNQFQFLPWKSRWKKYQEVSKNLIESRGFNYVVDFDIASFFDSIDHQLLISVLKEKLDSDLCDLLLSILRINRSDFHHICPTLNAGIPQGPIGSIVLSEVFLHHYVDQYFVKHINKNEIAYIRYADDIRIFAPKESSAKRFITILDLLCRNIGLIPQTSKVGVKYYESASEFLDADTKKFSNIDQHYKKAGKLKSKEDKKALELLKNMLKSNDIDKTKLSFYVYKVSKDDELMNLIIYRIEERYEFVEPFLGYLNKHYRDDEFVLEILRKIIIDGDRIFLDYPLHVFLNLFKDKVNFNSEVFLKLFSRPEVGRWFSKLTLLGWADFWKNKDIIISIDDSNIEFPLLKKKLISVKYRHFQDSATKRLLEEKLIKCGISDLTFKGISLRHNRRLFSDDYKRSDSESDDDLSSKYYDKAIRNIELSGISYMLKERCPDVLDPSILFCASVFLDENEFHQLEKLFTFVVSYYRDHNFKLLIDSQDQFNHILVERLFIINSGTRPSQDYGSILKNESFLSHDFINVRSTFLTIHEVRNNEFHPKDIKTGKFHSRKNNFEEKEKFMRELFERWITAISEIVSWYHRQHT